jgi:hypothetical protein
MKLVKIIPPEVRAGRSVATAQGTKVISEKGEINGIKSIKVNIEVDEPVTAEIELFVSMDELNGVVPRFTMVHPFTGERVEVREIRLKNGERIPL